MGEKAEGLRQRPGGQGVGAVPLMHQRDGGFKPGIAQIEVIAINHFGQHQPFVYDGARGHARCIVGVCTRHIQIANGDGRGLADNEQFPFKGFCINTIRRTNEYLPDDRLVLARQPADHSRIVGHKAPTQ